MAKTMRSRGVPGGVLGAVLCSAILFTGCAFPPGGILGILNGMLAWSRQDWAASVSSFLETENTAKTEGDAVLREYAVYGIASTYLAQDEYDSALVRLSELADASTAEIRAGVWYQAGVIAFRKGEYDQAASFFRKSLENDPSGLDAKINLELSRQSLVEKQADRASSNSGVREDSTPGQEGETIFNLVRKKEQDRWKNQEDSTPQTAVADY